MPGKLILRTGVEKWAKNKFKDLEGRFREIWKQRASLGEELSRVQYIYCNKVLL